jgi:hypothetical protein
MLQQIVVQRKSNLQNEKFYKQLLIVLRFSCPQLFVHWLFDHFSLIHHQYQIVQFHPKKKHSIINVFY